MNLRIALKEAQSARHRQHKFGAVLYKGGKPIVRSHNFSFIHAEHAVINKAWRSDIGGTTLLVIRVRKDGSLGMAKPCDLCLARISQAGIKKVVFSNQSGDLEHIRVDIDSTPMYLEYSFINKGTRQNKNV